MRQREGKPGGGKGPLLSEESLTLATANDQTIFQPVNFDEYNATVLVPYTDLVETLTSADRHAVATVGEWWNGDDIADTVTTTSNEQRMPDKNRLQAVVTPYAVRRLLPIECERLMGWPDDWTRWDADGKEQADSHRYKQCGNGVASPVAEWVGRHIFAADAIGRAR
jgi:site-specific DNA-cytosine methylase